MPKKEVLFDYIKIKQDLIDNLKNKFPDCESQDTLCVHYRSQDYYGHLSEFFHKGIKLPKSYYIKALEKINYKSYKKIYCLSDNQFEFKEMLKNVEGFNKFKFVESDSNIEDWLFIYLCKNIIKATLPFVDCKSL